MNVVVNQSVSKRVTVDLDRLVHRVRRWEEALPGEESEIVVIVTSTSAYGLFSCKCTGQLCGFIVELTMLSRSSDSLSQDNWRHSAGLNPVSRKTCGSTSWSWAAAACWALHDGKSWGLVLMANIRWHAHSAHSFLV